MAKPKVLILTGYGINCEEETKFAFERAGAKADLVHVNDLIKNKKMLKDYQIMVFPGGFSYGDDTGSGNALAWKIRNHLGVEELAGESRLVLGICNGFQVLANLGLLPALDVKYGERQVALAHNTSARYLDRWVDLKFSGNSPWVKDLHSMSLPIAHGEGNFYADSQTLEQLKQRGLVAARYIKGPICEYQNLPANPNGALDDLAGITDESGRIYGMMPHPERAVDFTQLPDWTFIREKCKRQGEKVPVEGPGIAIFENGVDYFR